MDYSKMPMRVEELPATTLVGRSLSVTLMEDRIRELWQYFAANRKHIPHVVGNFSYAVEVYPALNFFKKINPSRPFTRWAAVEVSKVEKLSHGLRQLDIPAGKYAVFSFQGTHREASEAFRYIYQTWLKEASYQLANRPHFAKMAENYAPDNPQAEEEFWIPIQ